MRLNTYQACQLFRKQDWGARGDEDPLRSIVLRCQSVHLTEYALDLTRHRRCRIDDPDTWAHNGGNQIRREGVVGATKHKLVDSVINERREALPEQRCCRRRVYLSSLNGFGKTGAG